MNFTLLALAFFSICINFVHGEDDDPLLFEGDIVLSKYEIDHLDELLNGTLYDSLDRNAVKDPFWLWTGGVVSYTFNFTRQDKAVSPRTRKLIEEAMAEFSNKTCIRFKPRTNEYFFINFVKGDGCWSSLGKGYGQRLSIGTDCENLRAVYHEIMHALGFFHEHNRNDRDEYIQINFDNIDSDWKDQFRKNHLDIMTHLGAEYDYCSVMHYSATAFSKNYKPTIVQKKPTCNCEMGKSNHLSDTDIREINTLYKCKGYPQIETNTTITTSTPKPTGRCVDNGRNCALKAQRGECELWEHSEYMHYCCAQSCNTCNTCITTSGDTCVFPFTYGGNDYNGCTNVDNNRAWCATKEQQTGSWWGNCRSECRMHTADSSGIGPFDSARSSSTYNNQLVKYGPQNSIGGEKNKKFFHSNQENYPWLEIKLRTPTKISDVTIVNRKGCCGERLKNAVIRAGMSQVPEGIANEPLTINEACGTYQGPAATGATIKILCSQPIMAQYITIQLENQAILQVTEVRINTKNLAVAMSSQLSGSYPADNCVDGNEDTFCHTQDEENPYFVIEYPEPTKINDVKVIARKNCCWDRVKELAVIVTNTKPTKGQSALDSGFQLGSTFYGPATQAAQVITFKSTTGITGKYVIVQQQYKGVLNLAEVQVNKAE